MSQKVKKAADPKTTALAVLGISIGSKNLKTLRREEVDAAFTTQFLTSVHLKVTPDFQSLHDRPLSSVQAKFKLPDLKQAAGSPPQYKSARFTVCGSLCTKGKYTEESSPPNCLH